MLELRITVSVKKALLTINQNIKTKLKTLYKINIVQNEKCFAPYCPPASFICQISGNLGIFFVYVKSVPSGTYLRYVLTHVRILYGENSRK